MSHMPFFEQQGHRARISILESSRTAQGVVAPHPLANGDEWVLGMARLGLWQEIEGADVTGGEHSRHLGDVRGWAPTTWVDKRGHSGSRSFRG